MMNLHKKYFAILLLAVFAIVIFLVWRDNQASTKVKVSQTPPPTAIISEEDEKNMEGLKIEDIIVGAGAEAQAGKKVTVNYSGTLLNGTKFDSSYDRGVPFSFNLGAGEVIQGWDLGILEMKVGGKRKLTIPSELGYGTTGAGGVIPPNATLVFEVELLKVK
ncbi:MAG: FKBP-type peptidyl-prolyl cis-trans isomerase [bacterium]|nr:FKBP-type peptidyl-prolyl cis-trans isomerase [bacterium]